MESRINIGGQNVRLIANAAAPFLYKNYFGRDFFRDLFTLSKALSNISKNDKSANSLEELSYDDIERIDIEIVYRLLWLFAKMANKDLPEMIDWFSSINSLPISVIMAAINPLINSLMGTKKKSNRKKRPPAKRK